MIMKQIWNRLRDINARLADCDSEMQAVSSLPFYRLFGREAQREKDLAGLRELKTKMLHEKLQLLAQLRYRAKQEAESIKDNNL